MDSQGDTVTQKCTVGYSPGHPAFVPTCVHVLTETPVIFYGVETSGIRALLCRIQQTPIPSACLTFIPGQALGSRYQAREGNLAKELRKACFCPAANAWDLAC